MKRFRPLIRVTCVIMCFLIITGIFASCKKEVEETVASTTSEPVSEEISEELTEEISEEETNKSTTKATTRPSTYKDDVDENFPYTLCTYTTNYKTSQKDRSTNLAVASRKINDLVLPTGAVFSFNGVVGKRSKENGFKDAIVFNAGEEERGIGGGICQVSSTVFQAALRSNLTILERRNHSRKVGYVPLGCDATVFYGSQDFKFTNNHPCAIKIKVYCSGGKLTCKILAEKNIDFGNVRIKVTGTEKSCTLVRYVNGTQNYKTHSAYLNGSDANVNVDIENNPNENATTEATTTTTTQPPTEPINPTPPPIEPTEPTPPPTEPTEPTQPPTEPTEPTPPPTEPSVPSTEDSSQKPSESTPDANNGAE